MKLLKITDDREFEEFDELFEETRHIDIEQVSPSVIDETIDVKIDGESIKEYDGAFLRIPRKNAVFGRVLLEIMEENGLKMNYSSTAFFTMAKKNYLYYVLHDKDIRAPKTVAVASEKAVRNIDKELEFPVIGREFENMTETETSRLEDMEAVKEFAEGVEYGEDVLLFQESVEGDKYRCFIAGDTVISLADKSEGWQIGKDNLNYSTLSQDIQELVKKTRKALGTPVAEVLIKDDQVIDVNPNPDLETYTDISGKNAFEAVAKELKEE